MPLDLRRAKGWAGQLVEAALGAPGGSRPEPDFSHLGVELKTLPVDARGQPRESTWVCTAPMDATMDRRWEESRVRHKLAHVLWVPIVGDRADGPGERILGAPSYWEPSAAEEDVLRADWEELSEALGRGELRMLHGRVGKALQLRPKAARGDDLVWALDDEANWVQTVPLGFYLRARFTRGLLARHTRASA